MSPNRIVAFLTPLVFAPLAGVISTWAADNMPGVNIPSNTMEEIFIAGALIALAPAAQWLYGWQKYEQAREVGIAAAAATVTGPVVVAETLPPPEPDLVDEELDEFEDLDDLDDLDDFDEFEETSVEEPVSAGS